MPFSMKIQPIDSHEPSEGTRVEPVKPVVKSRLKRLFERQFPGVLRNSAAEKIGGDEPRFGNVAGNFEPSSECLAKMVQSFMEDNRCNCFDDISDAESHALGGFGESTYSSGEAHEILKSLVTCASVSERNLLADTTKIVEKNRNACKRKDDGCRKIVIEGLLALGYEASICKSRWEKSPFCPAGEYEYIDVIMGKERWIIDFDFRSEFEIARSTKTYKAILQTLPDIFVGKCDRLQNIVAIVSEAAKQSLKKKGMPVPPWRKVEYVRAKWLSPYTRTTPPMLCPCSHGVNTESEGKQQVLMESGGQESREDLDELVLTRGNSNQDEDKSKMGIQWKPPVLKPKSLQSGVKVVTGLAAVLRENP